MSEYPSVIEWQRDCDCCEGEGTVERHDQPLHHLHSEAPEYAKGDCGECDGRGWNWTDEPCTLQDCRPGPFLFEGTLGFKTEYGASVGKDIGSGKVEWTVTHWPDAYCMSSGEIFWGGATGHEGRSKLLVFPVETLLIGEPS